MANTQAAFGAAGGLSGHPADDSKEAHPGGEEGRGGLGKAGEPRGGRLPSWQVPLC